MKRTLLTCFALAMLFALPTAARAQDGEFIVARCNMYITDKNGQPWSDLTNRLIVGLHPEHTQELPNGEAGANNEQGREVKFTSGPPKQYELRKDASGRTFATVDWVVFNDPNRQVVYRVGVLDPATKREISILREGGTKLVMKNDKKCPPVTKANALNNLWSIIKRNWIVIASVMLLGILLAYFLVFRWMFAGLLKKGWGVGAAQNLTWALSLLVILAFIAGLAVYMLGMRVETYALLGLAGATLLLVLLVGLISGSKTTA
ncbi:MAG TPA: hypothetical protein VFX96_16595 [Pyrinomonadaceae bacterium]|nr:hypothetical protein [Pyrinomonadaceae bacterium]